MKNLAVFLSLLFCMSDTRGSEWDITYDNNGEFSAEPGVTAVLGCTFIHPPEFHPTAVAWLECGSKRCEDGDVIFHSGDVNATKGHLRGRMSLLEPDLGKKNCSVIIWDLDVSDSGSYAARVEGQMNGKTYALDAELRKPIKVTGLRQPRIGGKTTVPEGGTLNITCDAQSSPPSTVIWNEDGSDCPLVTGTQTASLVILNVTTEHSGRYSCTAHHLTKTLTAFADVTVMTRLRQPRISGKTTVPEGGTLNITCDAQSSPPSTVKWYEDGSDSPLVTGTQTASLVILKVTTEHSGRYSCTEDHLSETLTAFADVTVIPILTIPNHVTAAAIITIILFTIVALVAIGAPMAYMIHRCRVNFGEPLYETMRELQPYLQTGGDDGPDDLSASSTDRDNESGQDEITSSFLLLHQSMSPFPLPSPLGVAEATPI